ncbi:MAG: hypothetical protein ACRC6R_10180 [Bacteroidales bacterium]
MIKEILLNAIKLLNDSNEFKYVAKDWGQLEMSNAPIQYPCALADLTQIECTTDTKSSEKMSFTLTLKLADHSSAISTMRGDISTSLDYLDTIERVICLLRDNGYQFVRAYNNPEIGNIASHTIIFRKGVRIQL